MNKKKYTCEKSHSIVYLDLEYSGLAQTDEILQIGAKFDDYTFSVYVTPTKKISCSASKINGMSTKQGILFINNKQVQSSSLKDALLSFHEFLSLSNKPVLLVSHNAKFDASRLTRAIVNCNLEKEFRIIIGFTDSIALMKKHLPDRKGADNFKLSSLASDLLGLSDTAKFHNASFDVEVLQQLIRFTKRENELLHFRKNYETYLEDHLQCNKVKENLRKLIPLKSVVSQSLLKKMAKADFTVDSLKECYKQNGEITLLNMLSEKLEDGKPRVTTNKKSLAKILNKIKNEL